MLTFNSAKTKAVIRNGTKYFGQSGKLTEPGTGLSILAEDPDYSHVPHAADNVANHYIATAIKPGDTEEDHYEACRLFGIRKAGDGFMYHPELSLIGRTKTLEDYAEHPIDDNSTVNSLLFDEMHPIQDMGKGKRARPIRAINDIAHDFSMLMRGMQFSSGMEPKSWLLAARNGNQQAIAVSNRVNHVINSVPDHFGWDPDDETTKEFKNAKFMCCFCPSCQIGRQNRVASQWIDVQHHIAAAHSADERVRESYRHAGIFGDDAQESDADGKKKKPVKITSKGFHLGDIPNEYGGGNVDDLTAYNGIQSPHNLIFHHEHLAQLLKTVSDEAKRDISQVIKSVKKRSKNQKAEEKVDPNETAWEALLRKFDRLRSFYKEKV